MNGYYQVTIGNGLPLFVGTYKQCVAWERKHSKTEYQFSISQADMDDPLVQYMLATV